LLRPSPDITPQEKRKQSLFMLIRPVGKCKSLADDRQHGPLKVLGKMEIGKELKDQSDVTGLIECQLVYRGPSAGLGPIRQLCQLVFSLFSACFQLLFFYSSI
jgi:hypothetical protein